MRWVRSSIAVLGFVATPWAHAQVTVDWSQPSRGVTIALDAADNVYTLDYEQALGAEMILTKRGPDGTLLWQASHDQTDPTAWERASWVATDSAGNAIVVGTLMSGYSNPVEAASIVMKFDPSGAVLWRRVYESAFDGSFTRKCLVDASDHIYVLGMGSGPAGFVAKVKKLASDGTTVWNWYDGDGIGVSSNFKFTPDGAIVIAARSRFGSVNGYAKIDRDGTQLWSLPGVNSLTVGDAAGDGLGNSYLVHGEYVTNGGTVLKKLDPVGNLLWEQTYALAGFRVEVGSDDQAVVGGFPNPNQGGAAFLKVDRDGRELWLNPDADGPLALLLHAHMLIDGADAVYLAAGTLFEMAVCKVNADGSAAWTQTTTGSYANAIALGRASNSVFVVGGATARLGQSTRLGPGEVLGTLRAVKRAGGVALSWDGSCAATAADDYAVYEGAIGAWADPGPLACSTAGALTIDVVPSIDSGFFLVAPRSVDTQGSLGAGRAAPAVLCAAGYDGSGCR